VNLKQASKRATYVAGALHAQGLQIYSVHVIPEPAIRVDKKPPKVDTWAYVPPPPGCIPSPIECVALVGGVRVTWYEQRTF
jgi:hypothetical protein